MWEKRQILLVKKLQRIYVDIPPAGSEPKLLPHPLSVTYLQKLEYRKVKGVENNFTIEKLANTTLGGWSEVQSLSSVGSHAYGIYLQMYEEGTLPLWYSSPKCMTPV